MALTIRELVTKWSFDVDDRPLEKAQEHIDGITSSLVKMGVAFVGAGAGVGFLLKKAGEIEQVEIAFETMLGSAEAAAKLLEEITEFAATTPFELPGLIDSSKQLLAFGIEADKIVDTMRTLGNIAAGVGRDKLPSIILAFGKIRTKGKASMEELNILLEAGVPVLDALAKRFDTNTQALFKMVSAGKVGFDDVDAALRSMAEGSGQFANLMERQSRSLLGMVSNVIDFFTVLAIDIGRKLLPEAKRLTKQFIDFVEINREMIKGRAVEFFKSLTSLIKILIGVFISIGRTVLAATRLFGGLENAIKLMVAAFVLFHTLNIVKNFGELNIMIAKLIVSAGRLAFGFKRAGDAALFAQLKAAALPLAIGAAVIGAILLIDDFIAYVQGRPSVIGMLFKGDKLKNASANLSSWIDNLIDDMMVFGKNLGLAIVNGLTDIEDDKVQGAADKVMTLLEIAIKASTVPFAIGIAIATGIIQGMREHMVKEYPKIAKFLGLTDVVDKELTEEEILQRIAGKGSGDPTKDLIRRRNQMMEEIALRNEYYGPELPAPGGGAGISINSPITVNVPDGTPPDVIGPAITDGIREAFDSMIREANRANQPAVEF